MYNNSNHDWAFQNSNSRNSNEFSEPLREPVAFEDFQFSLGLDPDFAMPIQLDIPPTSTNNSSYIPPPLSFPSGSMNTSVLNEQDQKAFSQFLDQFYVDPNMQIDPQPFYFSSFDDEQPRQTNILHSQDVQKKSFRKPSAFQSVSMSAPYNESNHSPKNFKQDPCSNPNPNKYNRPYGSPGNSNRGGGPIRRGKFNKELLTEEEKRNNHIASEQKRRGMIRTGFKDLTDIVPTLKNINNSKSTVLFKAVDYIRHLERRNKSLREKIKNLEVRAEVEGRTGGSGRPPYQPESSSTQSALLQHKSQQKQLYELQEKLQHHKKLLTQQKRFSPSANSNTSSFWHNENTKNEYEDIVSA
ncbi:hypothetical protein G6F56_009086 [Rhizopus delemar]|nr:hypothetical protein G6F56_009086 [Rhizopus delemar]